MSWQAIEDAIQVAIAAAAGVPSDRVIWEYQNSNQPLLDYIAIALGGVLAEVGQDGLETSTDLARPAGQEIAIDVIGVREAQLQVVAFSTATVGDGAARAIAEKVRTSLRLPSIRDALAAVGVSVFDHGSVSYVPEIVAIGFRGRSTLDMRCYLLAPTAREYLGYIASAGGVLSTKGGGVPGTNNRAWSAPA